MTLSSVLEIGLGLILVYYVLSAIVTAITGSVSRITNMSATRLASGLRDMLIDSGRYEQLYTHPLIQGLSKKQLTLFGSVEVRGIDYVPSQTFALALFDVLAPGVKPSDADALTALRTAAEGLPPGKTRDSLVALLTTGGNSIDKAQERVAAWFDSTMASVSDLYTQYARRVVWIVALVVTLILGVDTVDIGRTLWQQPTVRAAAAAEAATMAEQEQLDLKSASDVQSILDRLAGLQIPLTWDFNRLPNTALDWALKVVGLILTWIAAAQGAPFWYDMLKKLKGG